MASLIASCAQPLKAPEAQIDAKLPPSLVNAYPYPISPPLPAPTSISTQPEPRITQDPTPFPLPTEPAGMPYQVQSADTLEALARRFGVPVEKITSDEALPITGFLSISQTLYFPGISQLGDPQAPLIPDSEVVYSPSAARFDVIQYVQDAGGFLAGHSEYLESTGWNSAAEITSRIANEFSINPLLLLSLLEHECGCLRGPLGQDSDPDFLLGVPGFRNKGLYHQLEWAANRLSEGYYGWRSGALIEFQGANGIITHPAAGLNAGSVALAYYFWQKSLSEPGEVAFWRDSIDLQAGLPALHAELFGDPWKRASEIAPLISANLSQPTLELPFEPGILWSYSSGPHPAWGAGGAQAALDFAPAVPISGCVQTDAWIVAVADGFVVRSELGIVVQDLYPNQVDIPIDGLEQSGWAVVYLHVEDHQRVARGTFLRTGERIGHPSCEGGRANGTHVHIARKYNGEWMAADGPVPFVLSGWTAHAGEAPYQGTLTLGKTTLVAHPNGSRETQIMKSKNGP